MKQNKKWMIGVLVSSLLILSMIAALVIYVDPFFHYRKPLSNRTYIMEDQRYINDGIAKHFDYDALITGSSMTENFIPSTLDGLFGTNSVKLPFSGGSYKEVNDLVRTACENNSELKMVVRGLDFNRILNKKDDVDYTEYPEYIYDDNYLNDVKYLLNMEVLMRSLQIFLSFHSDAEPSVNFDTYSTWNYDRFSTAAVKAYYHRSLLTLSDTQPSLTQQERSDLAEHIDQNVIALAKEYPNIDFYIFICPYNICYWDYFRMEGNLEKQLEAEQYLIEALLPYDNIHFYSFHLQHDTIENLENYADVAHYNSTVADRILQWIKDGTGLMTKDNYEAYLEKERDYYRNFDYEAFFEGWPN